MSVNLLHLTINASPTPRALFFSTFESTKATEEVKASEISGQAEAAVQTNGSGYILKSVSISHIEEGSY